jgi:tRNA threonylcarbamoyl adenosine modification protein YjeE
MPADAAALEEQICVRTPAEMRQLGSCLARLLRAGDLVILSGPLGAGKTTLVQGVGRGLEVRGPITSPTFVLARVHRSLVGGPDLVHADAYRLGSRAEVDDLDLDTDLCGSVLLVEWGEGLVEELSANALSVAISLPAAGPDASSTERAEPRSVRIVGRGDRWRAAADALRLALSGEAKAR